ncbi:MAG: hypothetical protein GY823_14295 [Flavobacteriaceae bacterium]|nr:hypothetical protein [Flavobacteriaceae bacterium]
MEEVYSGIKTQNIKYEWSKNYLINQAYSYTLKVWYLVNDSKGSLGSWLGESAQAGKEVKNNIKDALNELRIYKDGKYYIRKNINWKKIKTNINSANLKIKEIKGPLIFITKNWNNAKKLLPKLKSIINNFFNYFENTKKLKNKNYDIYINKVIRNNIYNSLSFIKEFMPFILIGKYSRIKKKEIKKNIIEIFINLQKNEWELRKCNKITWII